ncbi:hypothetical protein VIM7927_04316 [Vibrio mangrovi]|nr:hypothetical protein VIM7927_04316 [Vibrio mangrovi]
MHGFHDFHFGLFGGGYMFLFWILLIGVVVWWVVSIKRDPQMSALDLAKKRYANGEITKDELDEIKSHL